MKRITVITLSSAVALGLLTGCSDAQDNRADCQAAVTQIVREEIESGTRYNGGRPEACRDLDENELNEVAEAAAIDALSGGKSKNKAKANPKPAPAAPRPRTR